jgi:hypothetical protein
MGDRILKIIKAKFGEGRGAAASFGRLIGANTGNDLVDVAFVARAYCFWFAYSQVDVPFLEVK